MAPFRKRVSIIEKVYLAYNNLRPPFANQFIVEGTGRIERAALDAAVARATAVNPGSRLRLSGRLGLRAWVPGPPPRVSVVEGATWDGRGDGGAWFLDTPLDPAGPTCDVQVLHGALTHLVFRSLHGVMDGGGTMLWALEVLRALRGEPLLGHESAITDSELAAGLTDAKMTLPPRDALPAAGRARARTSGNDFQWRRVTIPEPADTHLAAAMMAVLATEARRHGVGRVRINVPADLRFFHKEERTTGNAIGSLFVDVPADATAESIALDLKARLRAREHARFPAGYEQLRWLPMGALEALMKRGFANEHATNLYSFTATIAQMPSIDPATVRVPGFTPATTFWVPPMADQVCFAACNRYGSKLELMLALPRVFASEGRFEALFERLVEAVSSRRA